MGLCGGIGNSFLGNFDISKGSFCWGGFILLVGEGLGGGGLGMLNFCERFPSFRPRLTQGSTLSPSFILASLKREISPESFPKGYLLPESS